MNFLDKFSSWYFKDKITLMKEICFYSVDNIINTLEQHDDFKNKEMRLIEVYFFVLSFISHIFFLKNSKTYANNQIFKLFLSDIFNKTCSIYRIDSTNLKKAANEFIIHYNDRKNRYIASFISDLNRHQFIFSETIHDFILNLYAEIDSNEINKITVPFGLQLSFLITTCNDRL